MPESGKNILKFVDHHMKIQQPFMTVADFETYTLSNGNLVLY